MPGININFIDVIDIIIVALFIHQLLRFIRGSRAMQMFIGIALILLATLLSNMIQFRALSWILNSLKSIWILAFVIVFQPEIRRALTDIGKSKLVRYFIKEERKTIIVEIIKSVQKLTDRGIGGLIVLEGQIGLKHIIDTGTPLNANLNSELIVTIFTPKSPLHDGAMVIKDEKIIAASCILPLSENPMPGINLGTRHRAALGMSEESDALIIVVSEERRSISIAEKGNLKYNVDANTLEKEINRFY